MYVCAFVRAFWVGSGIWLANGLPNQMHTVSWFMCQFYIGRASTALGLFVIFLYMCVQCCEIILKPIILPTTGELGAIATGRG